MGLSFSLFFNNSEQISNLIHVSTSKMKGNFHVNIRQRKNKRKQTSFPEHSNLIHVSTRKMKGNFHVNIKLFKVITTVIKGEPK